MVLSGCGWEWPSYEGFQRDPLSFLGDNGPDENIPPPPSVIPKDAPDQNDPHSTLIPASTMGLNLNTYFAQDIDDPNTRIQRLENVLVAVHHDMQQMSGGKSLPVYKTPEPVETQTKPVAPVSTATPAPAQEGRTVLASGGPENLVAGDTAAPTKSASTPVYEKKTPAKATAPKFTPNTSGPTTITGLRIGVHKDKVRIVMDVTRKTLYSADLDNGENLLIVELPDAGWSAAAQKSFGKTPLLKSYRIDPFNDGKGHILVLELKGSSSIIKQMQIPALTGGGQRIFIDLAR